MAIGDNDEVSSHDDPMFCHTDSHENQIAGKRQDEKPPKVRLLGVAKTEDAKLQRRRITNRSSGTQMAQLHPESSSLSPTSCDSEEQTSATDSPEPEFTNGILDSLSISIRAYTDTDPLDSSFDNPYSSYGQFHNQSHETTVSFSSNILGVQEFSSVIQEYTPFVLEEHLDYYDQCFFGQDGSFVPFVEGLKVHDKPSELRLTTGGAHLGHATNGNGYSEANCGSSRRRDGMTTDFVMGDNVDVDFSKWLLTVEAQDGKDDPVAAQAGSTLGGPRATVHSEYPGEWSGPKTCPDVRYLATDDGTMQKSL